MPPRWTAKHSDPPDQPTSLPVELPIDGHGAVATMLVDSATAGGVTGPERLGLRSPLPYMELGECVSRSEGGDMLLDPLEALWLEAGQQSAKASPHRSELFTGLDQTGRE